MNNKKVLLAPLMGAIIGVFIFSTYLMSIVNYKESSVINAVFSLLSLLPLMTVVFIAISYIVCMTVGIPLVYIKDKFLLSPNFFWLLTFLVGSVLGILLGFINYKLQNNIAKSIAITLSFIFGGLFSASLYSVLNGDVKNKQL